MFLKQFCLFGGISLAMFPFAVNAQEQQFQLGLPIDCTLGADCFIQQMTDMDVTKGVSDPYCGIVSYDGHKGTDIRLRRLTDMRAGVKVLAAEAGIVRGMRNNIEDHLVKTPQDREKIRKRECGNGAVIDHGHGIETQYCHLMKGSIRVKSGDRVQKGDVLGLVGASGLTQFPHVHLSVRKDGHVLDPFTGRMAEQGCAAEGNTWWGDKNILDAVNDAQLLDAGVTGDLIKHEDMVVQRPSDLKIGNDKSIGWVWYANLRAKDQVFISLTGPNGSLGQNLNDPVERSKASWSGFIGKKRAALSGKYTIETYILRDHQKIRRQVKVFEVK